MATINDYTIDANQALGNNYSKFKSELYAFALMDPKGYYTLRTGVLEKVKINVVKDMYNSIYHLLKHGTDKGNSDQILEINGIKLAPCLPEDKINSHAMSGAEMMNDYIDDIVDIILPVDFATIMSKQLGKIGTAQNPQAP
jgi:hypothetical protein